MRLSIPILFLTLVLSGLAVNAAPFVDLEPDAIKMSPQDKSEPIYSSLKSEHPWSLRLGTLGGAINEINQAETMLFLGLRYDIRQESPNTWQIEASGAKDNFIHVVVGKKFPFFIDKAIMPYYKFSVGDLIDSTEGIGSVLNLKKIQAMAALGLENLFVSDQHLQAEIGVSYALIGPQFEVSLGFAF